MKQGLNFELPISLEVNLDDVQTIDFIFVQGDVKKTFTYPSESATRLDNSTVNLAWTSEDTWLFKPVDNINMDTKITMVGTVNNPETPIVSFTLAPTLFEKEEE